MTASWPVARVDEGHGAGEEGWWVACRRMASTFMAHRLNLCGKDLNLYDNVQFERAAITSTMHAQDG